MIDEFGDRMKAYENSPLKMKYDGRLPLYMRLDGRSFSKFTKKLKLEKPRDMVFSSLLEDAAKETMKEFNFKFGFVQSDEISLFFPMIDNPESQLPFDGKTQKLLSVIPSYFTSVFVKKISTEYYRPESFPCFDARLVEFPDEAEATNMLIWRWKDARRNYISDLSLTKFSAKQLNGVKTEERLKMIGEPINENDVGTFLKKLPRYVYFDENGVTVRHKIENFIPEKKFSEMTFAERVNLIYGEEDYV